MHPSCSWANSSGVPISMLMVRTPLTSCMRSSSMSSLMVPPMRWSINWVWGPEVDYHTQELEDMRDLKRQVVLISTSEVHPGPLREREHPPPPPPRLCSPRPALGSGGRSRAAGRARSPRTGGVADGLNKTKKTLEFSHSTQQQTRTLV